MSREFLTWMALEIWYETARMGLARMGAILSREVFIDLPVMPIMKPGTAAQMFGMGAEVIGVQVMQQFAPNRPVAAPNGRN